MSLLQITRSGGATPESSMSNDLAGRSTALAPPCLLPCFGNSVNRKKLLPYLSALFVLYWQWSNRWQHCPLATYTTCGGLFFGYLLTWALRGVRDSGWPGLAWGFSDLKMTWLLYCAGAATAYVIQNAVLWVSITAENRRKPAIYREDRERTLVCFCLSDWSHGARPITGLICSSVLCFSSIFSALVIPTCRKLRWPALWSTFGRTIK